MRIFMRLRAISNVIGFTDYCSGYTKQQEFYIIGESNVDWRVVAKFETEKLSTYQAREIVIALPNEWVKDPANPTIEEKMSIKKHMKNMLTSIFGHDKIDRNEVDFHVHYNKKLNNLHCHVIYTDRQFNVGQPIILGTYDRNIYFAVCMKKDAKSKLERARDSDGNFIVKHRKGDNRYKRNSDTVLGNRDDMYWKRQWREETRDKIKDFYIQEGITVLPPWPLHEEHEGKAKGYFADLRKKHNEIVRGLNEKILCDEYHNYDIPRLQRDLNGPNYVVKPVLMDYFTGYNYDAGDKFSPQTMEMFKVEKPELYVELTKTDFEELKTNHRKLQDDILSIQHRITRIKFNIEQDTGKFGKGELSISERELTRLEKEFKIIDEKYKELQKTAPKAEIMPKQASPKPVSPPVPESSSILESPAPVPEKPIVEPEIILEAVVMPVEETLEYELPNKFPKVRRAGLKKAAHKTLEHIKTTVKNINKAVPGTANLIDSEEEEKCEIAIEQISVQDSLPVLPTSNTDFELESASEQSATSQVSESVSAKPAAETAPALSAYEQVKKDYNKKLDAKIALNEMVNSYNTRNKKSSDIDVDFEKS